ncbi:MAG: APC family permease [Mycobacterium sp.]
MSTAETVDKPPELKRVMGPGLLLLFVVGDILGTGVYALTGDVAAEVGGAAWLPFLVAFLIATITAFSYLELVTKYPQAAGAALYAHKAFGIQFVTFLIAFVVMCSGITSASTAARTFSSNFFKGLALSWGTAGVVALALFFMAALALINLRGVGESVKLNVFLTIIEISGLLLVILVGLWAFTRGGDVDFSRVVAFETADDKNAFVAVTAATSLAVIGCICSLYLVTPLSGRPSQQYVLAGVLVVIGVALFLLTQVINRQLGVRGPGITDPMHLADAPE